MLRPWQQVRSRAALPRSTSKCRSGTCTCASGTTRDGRVRTTCADGANEVLVRRPVLRRYRGAAVVQRRVASLHSMASKWKAQLFRHSMRSSCGALPTRRWNSEVQTTWSVVSWLVASRWTTQTAWTWQTCWQRQRPCAVLAPTRRHPRRSHHQGRLQDATAHADPASMPRSLVRWLTRWPTALDAIAAAADGAGARRARAHRWQTRSSWHWPH